MYSLGHNPQRCFGEGAVLLIQRNCKPNNKPSLGYEKIMIAQILSCIIPPKPGTVPGLVPGLKSRSSPRSRDFRCFEQASLTTMRYIGPPSQLSSRTGHRGPAMED